LDLFLELLSIQLDEGIEGEGLVVYVEVLAYQIFNLLPMIGLKIVVAQADNNGHGLPESVNLGF
jgi:hypothetical protein